MSITLTWYNQEKTIVFWEQTGRVTWDEIHKKQDELFQMLDTVNHKVDLIAYARDSTLPPNAIPNLKRLINRVHPNEGYKVVVNAGSFLRSLFMMVGRFNRHEAEQWHFAESIAEAEALLAKLHRDRKTHNGAM